MPANRHRILLHGGESRLKKIGSPAARQDAFRPATPRLTICSSLAILMSSGSQHHSLLSARRRSMSSFIYVLVFNLLYRISRLPDDNEQPNFC